MVLDLKNFSSTNSNLISTSTLTNPSPTVSRSSSFSIPTWQVMDKKN